MAASGSVHENLEALLSNLDVTTASTLRQKVGSQAFLKTFRHASIAVPYGEAAFLGGMGLSWKESKTILGAMYKQQAELRGIMKEGWKTGKTLFPKSPTIDETLLEISANNIKRNRKLKQNLLHGEAIKAPTILNAQRRQSHGVVRPPRKRLM